MEKFGVDRSSSGSGLVACCCVNGSEFAGSVNGGDLLNSRTTLIFIRGNLFHS